MQNSYFIFDLNKYLGTWYELAHYPSWFERNDNYNTTAHYKLDCDNNVIVTNSAISNGKEFVSTGTARRMGQLSFRVDFPMPEVAKLQSSGEFNLPMNMLPSDEPNYVIDKIWYNIHDEYVFAVVTDPRRESLYVLSRYPHPSLCAYNEVMKYVIENYNRDKLVQTPHFD